VIETEIKDYNGYPQNRYYGGRSGSKFGVEIDNLKQDRGNKELKRKESQV
jgi:hypothetical protein